VASSSTRTVAVLNYGDVAYHGSLTGRRIQSPITAVAVTPKGNGYLLVSAGGAVYAFGDVILHGSLVGRQLASPIVAVALSPDAKGYLLRRVERYRGSPLATRKHSRSTVARPVRRSSR